MASRAEMYRKAGDLIEALQAVEKYYFITVENEKIFISQDNEAWSERLQVWPEAQ